MRISFFLLLFSFLLTQQNIFAQDDMPKGWEKRGGKKLKKKPLPKPYSMPHAVYTANIFKVDTTHYVKRLDVFRYDSLKGKLDSMRIAQVWYTNDSMVAENPDRFYEWVPLQCSLDDVEGVVETVKSYSSYETCNPLACEVGGSSGYNKYMIHYNTSGWADTIQHLTDYYSDGKGGVNLDPSYDLSERYVFTYATNKETIETYDDRQELLERLIRHFDAQGRLISEERLHPATYSTKDVGIKIWYHYASP